MPNKNNYPWIFLEYGADFTEEHLPPSPPKEFITRQREISRLNLENYQEIDPNYLLGQRWYFLAEPKQEHPLMGVWCNKDLQDNFHNYYLVNFEEITEKNPHYEIELSCYQEDLDEYNYDVKICKEYGERWNKELKEEGLKERRAKYEELKAEFEPQK